MIDFKDICSVLNDHNTKIQSNKYLKLNKKFLRLSFTTKKSIYCQKRSIYCNFFLAKLSKLYLLCKKLTLLKPKSSFTKTRIVENQKNRFWQPTLIFPMFFVPLITNCFCFPTKKMFCFFWKNNFQKKNFFFESIPKIE